MKINKPKTAFALFIFFCIVFIFGIQLDPGIHPNAEIYKLEIEKTLLIQKILFFKKNNPKYSVPYEVQLEDNVSEENPSKHYIYFYYKPENQIVLITVDHFPEGRNKSQLELIGINQGLELGNWKEINRDYDFKESQKEKEKFEERILKPLNVVYHNDTPWLNKISSFLF